jgi:hypothetical protein
MNKQAPEQPFIDYIFSSQSNERVQKIQQAGRLTIKSWFDETLFDTEPSQLVLILNKSARVKL